MAFSSIDRDSYNAVLKWKDKVFTQCGKIPLALIETKMDIEEKLISDEEAKSLAEQLGCPLFQISTKENIKVKEPFTYLANAYSKFIKDGGNVSNPIAIMGEIKQKKKSVDEFKNKKENEKQFNNEVDFENGPKGKKKKNCIIF